MITQFRASRLLLPMALAFLLGCAGCGCDGMTENRLLVFLDQTDKSVFEHIKDDAAGIIKRLGKSLFPCEECRGGVIRVVQVRDNCQNKPLLDGRFAPLPEGTDPAGAVPNDYQNFIKAVKAFSVSVAQDSTVSGYTATCLYEPLCKELVDITDNSKVAPGAIKVIIYSDMLENSSMETSLYKHDSLTVETFESRLKEKYDIEIPNLNGGEIYIINHSDIKNQNKVRYACGLWKEMFVGHGAKVIGPKSSY
jgi:hypothetical protein